MNLLKIAQSFPLLPGSRGSGSSGSSSGQYISPNLPGQQAPNLPGGSGGVDITTPIVSVINWGIAVAGGIAVLILIISGILYVTAAGNEHTIERAKTGIKGAITGIVIILLAAIIVNTINFALTR